MKDVCPTEEFEVDVGSDPTIKVAYRPLLRHKESGSKTHLISYTQVLYYIVSIIAPIISDLKSSKFTLNNAFSLIPVVLDHNKVIGAKLQLFVQDMDLKNSRKEPVNIIVTDQLPKSNDDKVKVSIIMTITL